MADPRHKPEKPITDDERRLTELLVERFGPRARRRHPRPEHPAENDQPSDGEEEGT
jgi:hypothetical protein